jgi:hypothetical protein
MTRLLAGFLMMAAGCATTFTGDAHIEPAACQAKCTAANMQFVGMVYMGEYSSACICDIPLPMPPPAAAQPPTAANGQTTNASGATAAAGAAATGVVMQMRRAAAQQQQQRH